jgi:hypothetical protein
LLAAPSSYPSSFLPHAGKFPFWDNVRDCTLQQVWKSILTDKINWNAAALREVSGHLLFGGIRLLHLAACDPCSM